MAMTDIPAVSMLASSMQSVAQVQRINAEAESFAAVLERAQAEKDDRQLRKACSDFESYFFQIMFREMRKTSFASSDGIFAKTYAQEMFEEMLDEEYSKQAAKAGGMGIAEMMYKQLSRQNII